MKTDVTRALTSKSNKKIQALDYGIYIFLVLIIVIFSLLSNNFLSVHNFASILQNALPLLIAATGITVVLISGDMDMSIGSAILCSATIGALLITETGIPIIGCLLITIAIGVIIGMINGVLIAGLHISSLLITLAMMLILKGVSFTLSNASHIHMPMAVTDVRKIKLFGEIPLTVLVVIMIILIMHFVIKYTVFGRHVCIIGSNRSAADRVGVNVNKMRFMIFTLNGFFAGLAGVATFVSMGSVTNTTASGYEFTAFTAVILGGTSMVGGKGRVFPNVLVGVFIMMCLENGLSMAGSDPYMFEIFRGSILFIGMLIDSVKNRNVTI